MARDIGASGSSIEPTPEAILKFASLPDNGPLLMLNLLKFKPNGRDAYMKYGEEVSKILAKLGATRAFAGLPEFCLLGDQDWDLVVVVQYPSRKSFLEMVTSNEYQAIHHHREEGLAHQVLYTMSPTGA